MTRGEQLRFQRLVRHFVHNFFDNELLAPDGEASKVFVTAFALLGATGFVVSLFLALKYGYALYDAKPYVIAWASASDNLVIILMTMSLMGLLVVLSWDGLLPSRRDGHVLSALPVPSGEIYRARLLATILLFSLVLAAFAAFPSFVLPVGQTKSGDWTGLLWRFVVQILAMSSAAAFVFFGVAALQSFLLALLPYARFVQVSGIVQVTILVGSFALLFLTPNMETASKLHWDWVVYLPPYWFFGFWQTATGGLWLYGNWPLLAAPLAAAVAVFSSLSLSALLAQRAMRKAVEGLPLSPTGPGILQRIGARVLDALLLREERERAIFWFAARTLARQRSHRLLLAIYFGLGLAWVLAGLSSILTSQLTKGGVKPNAVVCSIPVDLAAMLLIGMRVLYGMPVEAKANWMPRISVPEIGGFAAGAARKLMLIVAIVPMAVIPVALIAYAWGLKAAAIHLWLYLLETAVLLELLMSSFDKFPFACSWLPGQSNLKVKLGMYAFIFAGVSSFLGSLEAHILQRNATLALRNVSILLAGWLTWLLWRRLRSKAESVALSFEERSELAVNALQLQ